MAEKNKDLITRSPNFRADFLPLNANLRFMFTEYHSKSSVGDVILFTSVKEHIDFLESAQKLSCVLRTLFTLRKHGGNIGPSSRNV